MFTGTLFITAPNCKQPKFPTTDNGLKKPVMSSVRGNTIQQ